MQCNNTRRRTREMIFLFVFYPPLPHGRLIRCLEWQCQALLKFSSHHHKADKKFTSTTTDNYVLTYLLLRDNICVGVSVCFPIIQWCWEYQSSNRIIFLQHDTFYTIDQTSALYDLLENFGYYWKLCADP